MANNSAIDQIKEGMEIRTADGNKLGKIAQIYYGQDPGIIPGQTEEETCMEVRQGLLGMGGRIYVPCSAVADVSGKCVTLSVDTETVNSSPAWHHKPPWIAE